MLIRTSIIQEIVDHGLNKNHFSILDSIVPEKYHLYKEFYTEYSVFYFNERGGKDFKANFKRIEDAKEYLIDLYRINKGLNPFYSSVKNSNTFQLEKLKLIQSLTEDTKSSSNEKKKLISLLQELHFNDKNRIQELEEELMSYAFLVEESILIRIKIFVKSIY